MKNLPFVALLFLLFIQCAPKEKSIQDNTNEEHNLGEVSIQVTGSEEAVSHFTEGLLLLHSFEFDDAATKFVQAQKIDSNLVMAYWGEAMSYNHPLWKERYTEEGRAALQKLGKTKEARIAKAQTDLERDLLEAVEILYGEGEKKDLDVAYRDKMEQLHKTYSDQHEVAAFYALSLLGAAKNGRDVVSYEQGARIAQGIINENPSHPGALHYLIHSYDDPDHATLALDAANSYSKVAPDAEHALHMPSHIYVALGMWDEVIKSNIASYEASVSRMERKELDNDARGYHAFKWLMYGYLQKGDMDKAREMVYEMKTFCEEKPSSRARSHFIMMQGAYLTESNNWTDSIAEHTVDTEALNLMVRGVQDFTQGMLGYHNNDKAKLKNAINKLSEMRADAEKNMVVGSPKMCSGVSRYLQPPSVNEVNSIKVMEYELYGLMAMLDNNDEDVEKWLAEAADIEESTTYNYGPPNIVKPSFELYGEWLLNKDRKKEAEVQFEKVLKRAPKRRIAQKGMDVISA
ncbi:MAG: hypothetical protein P1U56_14745 [Saprospiraceae bacterium]|nr:hypothetical protein [Saprospiraceae bacterium]